MIGCNPAEGQKEHVMGGHKPGPQYQQCYGNQENITSLSQFVQMAHPHLLPWSPKAKAIRQSGNRITLQMPHKCKLMFKNGLWAYPVHRIGYSMKGWTCCEYTNIFPFQLYLVRLILSIYLTLWPSKLWVVGHSTMYTQWHLHQLPQTNPCPFAQSVLVLDNCNIHHNEALYKLVNGAGELYS